ncbi:unnamed protein product [Prorocentrum cordatum]|uniref:SGNH hydrolase-type esterase domain-containing protein n=1 Tax=Prorocentrum cordatum TaxID=2364126 RepID=A0ABN9TEG4_9DINO|nr:unnamed protein product [Polarella glacialis]
MDDVGLQYVSPVLREVSNLARAAKAFTSDAGDLGMVLKPPKSGCIPGNQKVWGQLKRHLGTLKIPYRVVRFRKWGADPVVVQDPELAQDFFLRSSEAWLSVSDSRVTAAIEDSTGGPLGVGARWRCALSGASPGRPLEPGGRRLPVVCRDLLFSENEMVFSKKTIDKPLLSSWLEDTFMRDERGRVASGLRDTSSPSWQVRRRDVHRAIKLSGNGAPGPDGILYKAWKKVGDLGVEILFEAVLDLAKPDAAARLRSAYGAEEHDFNLSLLSCLPKKRSGVHEELGDYYLASATRPLTIGNTGNPDDIGAALEDFLKDAGVMERIFSEFASISGLELNLPKTVVIPLWEASSGDRAAGTISAMSDFWSGVAVQDSSTYLGFLEGPGKRGGSWSKASGQCLDRCTLWGSAPLGLQHSARTYDMFGMSVLGFLAQLEQPPPEVLKAEVQAARKSAAGPMNWIIPEDCWHWRESYGQARSFTSLRYLAHAAQVQVACWEQLGQMSKTPSLGVRGHGRPTWPNECRKGFQRELYRQIAAARAPNPEVRMRYKLTRWLLPGYPARTSRQVLRNLQRLQTLVAPRLSAACLSTLWNRWTTARRFQVRGATRFICWLGCGPGPEDSVEHYLLCPSIRAVAARELRLRAYEWEHLLFAGSDVDDESFTCLALLVYAAYNTFNLFHRRGAPGPGGGAAAAGDARARPGQPALRTGQRVVLQGLEKARELNGHRGVVVKWKADVGRYAVRVAGKEMAIKLENLKVEGGAAEAAKFQQKWNSRPQEGAMYNPAVYARMPGAGPKVTQWIGQVKAGRRCVVRAGEAAGVDGQPVPLWFGDQGFVGSAPVDVALLIPDVGASPQEQWPKALGRVLGRFPVAAGRLRHARKPGTNQFLPQIVVSNAGVPFTTASVPPCGLPSAGQLQDVCQEERCSFFDLGAGDAETAAEEPLLRMKLVYEEGTSRGVLGVSFSHVLCDISGLALLLRWMFSELDAAEQAPEAAPSHARALAQEALDAVPAAGPEQEEAFLPHWPLHERALERWCFFARRLRAGMRGRPDGAATVCISVPASTLSELKAEAAADGFAGASAFEALVSFLGMRLLRLGRHGRRALLTKDYRAALGAAAPGQGQGLENLFANAVTHGVSFELPCVADVQDMPLAASCKAMRGAIDAVSLEYVSWHSKQDHHRGLPNFFGGLCCNTWGRALAELSFVETYAIGHRSVDERAANMVYPLDTAYMQVLPLPSGDHTVLLTMPISDATALLRDLPESHFHLPHVSQMRAHPFRQLVPSSVVDRLNPPVETHHMFARIACIGDSLTACGYPKYLQALFDRADIPAQVRGFGVPGATATRFSDQPYWDETKFEDARVWRPHFVIVTLGTNDSKSGVWDEEAFEKDYRDLCAEFLARNNPKPLVVLVAPPPLYEEGAFEMQQEVVNGCLPDAVARVAAAARRAHNEPLEAEAARCRQQVPEELLARTAVVDAFGALGGAGLRRRGCLAADAGARAAVKSRAGRQTRVSRNSSLPTLF